MITSIKYTNPDNTQIEIMPGEKVMRYPTLSKHQTDIDAWLLLGNTITPFDPTLKQGINGLKIEKYNEIWAYAEQLNTNAELTFFNSQYSPEYNRVRLQNKRSKISNKKYKAQALNAKETKFDDDYDLLLDYQDSVNDIADLAQDFIEALNDKTAIYNYDVATTIVWPVWTPPA